jgi:hypothetical protein
MQLKDSSQQPTDGAEWKSKNFTDHIDSGAQYASGLPPSLCRRSFGAVPHGHFRRILSSFGGNSPGLR